MDSLRENEIGKETWALAINPIAYDVETAAWKKLPAPAFSITAISLTT
jgi:hypothetical protein